MNPIEGKLKQIIKLDRRLFWLRLGQNIISTVLVMAFLAGLVVFLAMGE